MWHETTHTITIKGSVYSYPIIKSGVRTGKNKTATFSRIYGGKRTKEEAIAEVEQWYKTQMEKKHGTRAHKAA